MEKLVILFAFLAACSAPETVSNETAANEVVLPDTSPSYCLVSDTDPINYAQNCMRDDGTHKQAHEFICRVCEGHAGCFSIGDGTYCVNEKGCEDPACK